MKSSYCFYLFVDSLFSIEIIYVRPLNMDIFLEESTFHISIKFPNQIQRLQVFIIFINICIDSDEKKKDIIKYHKKAEFTRI